MGPELDFDANATAPLLPSVRARLQSTWQDPSLDANPASAHQAGQRARALLEGARRKLAAALDAEPLGVVWTSGGTEANQLAIMGALEHRRKEGVPHAVLCSPMEHPCVLACLSRYAERAGPKQLRFLKVDEAGRIDLSQLDQGLADGQVGVLTVMLAQHELGNCYDLPAMVQKAKALAPNLWIHCDAVQALGKMPLSFADLGVDSLALSAHKFGGPKGVGALVMRRGLQLQAQMPGGSQERGFRAGTPCLRLIDAMALAAQRAVQHQSEHEARCRDLYRFLRPRIETLSGVSILGDPQQHLGNTLCLSLDHARGQDMMMALDLEGIRVSTGAACSVGSSQASASMLALGLDAKRAQRVLRLSWGPAQEQAQGERLLAVLQGALARFEALDRSRVTA